MKTLLRLLLPAIVLAVACTAPAGAQSADSTAAPAAGSATSVAGSRRWHFVVEPYILAPSMSGTSGVGGIEADVEADAGDIFGALDMGAMLYLEMHDDTWALVLDGMYMDLGGSGTTVLGTVDVGMTQSGVMAAAFRRVSPWAEAMVGVQFNAIEGSLESSGPLGLDRGADKSWVDPYLGVRVVAPRGDAWRLAFMGYVGGFGIGSDFAWQAFPEVGYRFNPLFELAGGYRAIGMDYEDGDGTEKFVYDIVTYGPQLGLKFHF